MRTTTSQLSGAGRAAVMVAAVTVGYIGPRAPEALKAMSGDDFPDAALAVVHLVALMISSWALAVIAAGVAQVRVPGLPSSVRALLFTTAVMTAVAASPAQADSPRDLDGLTLPDRPMTVQAQAPSPSHAISVRSGDTLWAIATQHLPAGASDADIAHACAEWHTRNRSVIGPDPDLILPGQVLHPPTTEQDASS